MGHVSLDQRDWTAVEQHYHLAITIADATDFNQTQHGARWGKALMYLYQDDLANAWKTIDAALAYDVPQNNYNAHVVRGIIALRQGAVAMAQEALANAQQACDDMLVKATEYYTVKDARGLALCGLALLDQDASKVEAAKAVFREVRSYTSELKGHIKRVQRLFDALAQADSTGLLAGVRAAIAGE
jgi:tetratricopeptide (TPR) repeat protein